MSTKAQIPDSMPFIKIKYELIKIGYLIDPKNSKGFIVASRYKLSACWRVRNIDNGGCVIQMYVQGTFQISHVKSVYVEILNKTRLVKTSFKDCAERLHLTSSYFKKIWLKIVGGLKS